MNNPIKKLSTLCLALSAALAFPLLAAESTPAGIAAIAADAVSASRFKGYYTRLPFDDQGFTGKYADHSAAGIYRCICCSKPLFDSASKFDAGCGWPSYFQPLTPDAVATKVDGKLWAARTEVHCADCGGHLGHVFPDGPKPTGLRYCMNGVAMKFAPAAASAS